MLFLIHSILDDDVTMSQIINNLFNIKLRKKNSTSFHIEAQTLVTKNRGWLKLRDKNYSKSKSESRSRKDIICYNNSEKGYFKNQYK